MPETDPRTDLEIIDAANRGDAAAFETLYRRYRDWVVRLACRFTADAEDALDVLQDTFAYLLEKFPGFELRAKMTTFLYPVVKHLALARRRKRHAATSDDDLLAGLPARPCDPEDSTADDLASVLVRLQTGHREVLLMRFLDDMSLDEIATALAIPLGTVKSRLHHALAALRDDPRTREYFEQ
ncbi:MAG: sigma-70 family RNA polymerase sigma factor [Phycisphaerae bacterium]|nr:sigma-70 family RNA polymerase sigma factor [Phycisphaerae bacterium]